MNFAMPPARPCADRAHARPSVTEATEPAHVDRWRAEEVFLGWLVGLPPGIDPSLAATAVLARLEALAGAGPGMGELGRLRALLEETMSWSPPALAMLAPRAERRRRR